MLGTMLRRILAAALMASLFGPVAAQAEDTTCRNGLFAESPPGDGSVGELTETQRAILDALSEPRSAEDVGERVGLDAGPVRAELTMLELAGRVRRRGGLFERGR